VLWTTSSVDEALTVNLVAANMRVKIIAPSGSDATAGSYVVIPSDQEVSGQPKTTITSRTGSFGIAVSTSASPTDGFLGVGGPADYDSVNRNYALRLGGSGNSTTRTLYTDETFTTVKSAVSGVYQLNLRGEDIHGRLKASDGSNLTLPSAVHGHVVFTPAKSDGTLDRNFQGPKSSLFSSDGTFTAGLPSLRVGKYVSQILLSGSASFPSFVGPAIWVDADGKYSSTGTAGSYLSASSFLFSVNLPSASPNLVVKTVDHTGAAQPGYIDVDDQDNQWNWWGPNDTTNGIAAFVLPTSNYDLRLTPYDTTEIQSFGRVFVTVSSSGVATVTQENGTTINPDNAGVYVFQSSVPNVRLIVLQSGNSTSSLAGGSVQVLTLSGRYISNYGSNGGVIDFNIADGTYKLKVYPWGSPQNAVEIYQLTVTGGEASISDASNQALTAVNGRFTIRAAASNSVFRVVSPADSTASLSEGAFQWQLGNGDWSGMGADGGDIGLKMVDGTYNLDVSGGSAYATQRYTATKSGSTLTVTGPNGVVTPTSGVYLLAPAIANIKVAIVNPTDGTTPLTNSYVNIFTSDGNSTGGFGTWDQPIALKLADGDYTFEANTNTSGYAGAKYAVRISGSTVTVRSPEGVDITPVAGVFKISPTIPNVTLKAVEPGTNTAVSDVWFELRDFSTDQYFTNAGSSNGIGYLKLPNGKYKVRVHMGQSQVAGLADSEFVVEVTSSGVALSTTTGTAVNAISGVFPVALSNANVQLRVQAPNSTTALLNWSIAAFQLDADRNSGRYVTSAQAPTGSAGLNLPDGSYSLELNPAWDADSTLAKSRYELTVSGAGTVKVLKTWAGATVTAAQDGSFAVKPESSNLVIKVVNPSNTAQVINGSYVSVMNEAGQWLPGSGTNGAGKVAFKLDAGTYRLSVSPGDQISGLATKIFSLTLASNGTATVKDSADQTIAFDQASGAFVLSPAASNVSFKIVDPTSGSNLQNAWANIFEANGNNRGRWIANEGSGRLNFSIPDGYYIIEVNGSSATESYANKFYKMHVASGVASYSTMADQAIPAVNSVISLSPATANVRFNIVDPNEPTSVLSNGWSNVFETNGGDRGNWVAGSGGGRSGFSLADGNYQLEVNGNSATTSYAAQYFKLSVSGSTVTFSTMAGAAITAGSTGISLSPAVANALFSITNPDTGSLVTQSWANIIDRTTNQWLTGTGSNQGRISFSLPQGAYTIDINTGGNGSLAAKRYDFDVNSAREVSVTGLVRGSDTRFALALASSNLRLKVVSPSDPSKLVLNANVNVQNTATGNWVGVGGNTGYLSLRLEDGSYLMQLDPGPSGTESLARKNYDVTVSGGGTSVDVQDVVIDGTSHIFTVSPATPAVKGLVKTPTGGAVENSWVVPVNTITGEYLWQQGANSGSAGQFGISVPSGHYDLTAQVPWNNGYNLAKSAPCSVIVSGGAVTTAAGGCVQNDQSVILTLRDPNVSFFVADSSGTPLQNANVSLQFGSWNVWANSNSSGRVSFFVDPAEIKALNSWAGETIIHLRAYIDPPYGNNTVVRTECLQGTGDANTLCAYLSEIDLAHPTTPYAGAIDSQNSPTVRLALPNTRITVTHPNDLAVGAGAWVTLFKEVDNCPGCRNWLGGANTGTDGVAAFNLKDSDKAGLFSIEVNPTYNERGDYATVTYNHLTWAEVNGSRRAVQTPNLKLTIEQPGSGHKAAKWSWINIETLNADGTAVTGWLTGSGTTDFGKASLLLPSNGKFRLTINPGGGSIGARTSCDVQTNGSGVVSLISGVCLTGAPNSSGFTIALSRGNVTGIVTHGVDHAPLKGAIVYATKAGSVAQTFTTGEDGTFGFQLDYGDWLFKVFYVNEPSENIQQNVIGETKTVSANTPQFELNLNG
jgi:hypothetical protein